MNDQIWDEIVNVLNKAAHPMDVLAIRRSPSATILMQQTPKVLNKILYRKCDDGLVIKYQPNKNKKPVYSLPANANNQNNYNHNNMILPYPNSNASSFNQNNYTSQRNQYNPNNTNSPPQPMRINDQIMIQNYSNPYASSFSQNNNNQNNYAYNNNNQNMYHDMQQNLNIQHQVNELAMLSKFEQFQQTGYDIKFEDFCNLGGDFNKCLHFIQKARKETIDKPKAQSIVTRGQPSHKIDKQPIQPIFNENIPNKQAENNINDISNQPRYATHHINPAPRRGRGRGRGRGSFIKPITQTVPKTKQMISKPSVSSSNSPSLPAEEKLDDFKEVDKNISKIIGSPFSNGALKQKNTFAYQEYYAKNIGDKYCSAYLYHIQISENPNDSFGILIPKPIPEFCIPHISFPIQIEKNVEKKHRENIDKVIDDENKEGFKMSIEFDQQFKQNSVVTLHVVHSIGDDIEHKINKNAFEIIEDVNKFWFEKLDQRQYAKKTKHSKLQLFDKQNGVEQQNKFYLICPLIKNDESKEWEIDYTIIQKIHIASGYATDGKINGTEWCKVLKSNLKNELVESRQEIKSKNTKERYTHLLCMSYGVEKGKYGKIRKKKNEQRQIEQADDEKQADKEQHESGDVDDGKSDIKSIVSFANESIAQRWIGIQAASKKKVTSPNYASKHVVLLREEEEKQLIQNVLISTYQRKLSGFSVQSKLKYALLEEIFPTGIKSSMWQSLKNMPSILWSIENWLNVIDALLVFSNINNNINLNLNLLQQKDEMKVSIEDVNIDLTLLYQIFHRSRISSNMSYQIFNNLGAYILKFLCALFFFSTDSAADADKLNEDIRDIMEKTEKENLLGDIANNYSLMSYAILNDFHFGKWNPPQFKNYDDGKQMYDLIPGDNNLSELPSHLLQSIFGVYWSSIVNKQIINPLSYGINHTLQFLIRLNVLKDNFQVANEMKLLNKMRMKSNDSVNKLKDLILDDKIEVNILIYASLRTVLENCEAYFLPGITFDRLEVLGDAVLDMLIVWFIYGNLASDQTNIQQVYDAKDKKAQFKQHMTDVRHRYVNNNSLGYHFYKQIYLPTKNDIKWSYIRTFNDEIEEYTNKLSDGKEGNDEKEGNGISLYEHEKNQKSPGGFEKNDEKAPIHITKSKWPLKAQAPKIFGQTFEALLGAIFLISNCDQVFLAKESDEAELFNQNDELQWNLKQCVEFLNKYIGIDNFDKKFWDKWTINVNDIQR